MIRSLVIVPARGGSKGIPGKNLRLLLGVSLVGWTIRAARKAKRIDEVIVSTDSEEIANVARAEGATVVVRPAELAEDTAPTLPVLVHALDVLHASDQDCVVLCEPTSPFRSPRVLDQCVEKLSDLDCRSVVTVTQLERNPFNIFRVEGDRAERFIREPTADFFQRQQMQNLKRVNGCAYATRAKTIRTGHLIDYPLRVIELSSLESVNIDDPIDLKLAELIAPQFSEIIN